MQADLPKSEHNFVKETFECGKRLAKNKVPQFVSSLMSHSFIIVIIIIITIIDDLQVYVFNALSTIFLLFGVVGFGTFVPKYFEYHFRKPASSSGKKNFLRSLSYSFAHLLHIFRYLRGRNASRPNLLFSFL